MNERIKELAEQCRMMYKEGTQYVEDFDKEKFAELLIKDIVTTIAAQALMGESAVDVFTNVTRIYTDQPVVEDVQPVTPEDYDF